MARCYQEVTLSIPKNITSNNNKRYVFDSCAESPLEDWKKLVPRKCHVKLVNDEFLDSKVLEIFVPSISLLSTCYIQYPTAGVELAYESRLPYLIAIMKTFSKAFLIDILVQDRHRISYRIRIDLGLSHPVVKSFSCILPLKVDGGWTHLPIDLRDILSKVFNTDYKMTMKIRFHASCQLFKVYFAQDKPVSTKISLR